MTEAQARQLGTLIARTRERKGWSYRQLAAESDIPQTWIVNLERGVYASPAPERLARLAEALDIDPERIDRITRGYLSGSLPQVRTYFRSKYADLSDADIGKIESLLDELHDEHGGKRAKR
jgi:transcriptional regulator with XRE-family HTH domain